MVPMEGLEPPLRKEQVPKTCVSTNFTTWAKFYYSDFEKYFSIISSRSLAAASLLSYSMTASVTS